MELAQNFFALPGQGMTNAGAPNSPGATSVSADGNKFPSGVTPDNNAVVEEFGSVLNVLLGLAQSADSSGIKITPIIGQQNERAPQADAAIPTASTAADFLIGQQNERAPRADAAIITASSAADSQKPALEKNSVTPQSIPEPLNIITTQTDLPIKADTAGQEITQDAQPTIIFYDAGLPGRTNIAAIEYKVADTNAGNAVLSQSVIASTQAGFSDTPGVNSWQSKMFQSGAAGEPSENEITSPSDELLNSTAIIFTPATIINSAISTVPDQENPLAFLPEISISGEKKQNTDATTHPADGRFQAPSGHIVSGIPIDNSDVAQTPVMALIQQAAATAAGMAESKTPDQMIAQETPAGNLAGPSNITPAKQAAGQAITAKNSPSTVTSQDGQSQESSQQISLDSLTPQPPVNLTASGAALQIIPDGQTPLPANIKQAAENNISAQTQQPLQQGNAPIRPLHDQTTDNNTASPSGTTTPAPSQTQNNISSQLAPVDGKNFAQILTQNSDGLSVTIPESLPQPAAAEAVQGETGNIVLLDKQESARSSITPAIPRPEAQPHPVSPPIRDIAVHMAQHAETGINRFQLRLDPPELGRVDVRMEISADGKLSAVIAVERPETLDLLQRDSRALERSLMDAGLKTDGNSLSFSLKGGQKENQHSDGKRFGNDGAGNPLTDDWDDAVAPMTMRFANRAVNIRI